MCKGCEEGWEQGVRKSGQKKGQGGEPMRTLSWYLTGCGMETGDADTTHMTTTHDNNT